MHRRHFHRRSHCQEEAEDSDRLPYIVYRLLEIALCCQWDELAAAKTISMINHGLACVQPGAQLTEISGLKQNQKPGQTRSQPLAWSISLAKPHAPPLPGLL